MSSHPEAGDLSNTDVHGGSASAGDVTGEFTASSAESSDAPTMDVPAPSSPSHAATMDNQAPVSPSFAATMDSQPPVEPGSAPTMDSQAPVSNPFAATGVYTPGGTPGSISGLSDSWGMSGGRPRLPPHEVPLAPPVRADRYNLQNFHARGGMGEIWLALDNDIGRPVALKRMRREGNREQQERFLLEAQVTGQLEHPGVVPIYELGVDSNGAPFYVMKFLSGKTLKDVIDDYHGKEKKDRKEKDKEPAPAPEPAVPREVQWQRLLNIFVDICQTLAYAHSRGVLHRDMKPDNVMIGSFGETLVLDWGLAKVAGHKEGQDSGASLHLSYSNESLETQDGTVKGTPFYFAPEVADGRVNEVDHLSDVYLLGATLYQILTGKRPRSGATLHEIIEHARKKTPVPPRQLNPELPKELDAICMKAMAYHKPDRYPHAQALAEDVQRYLAGEPVLAYPEGFWAKTWRFVRKHRVALTRAATALLVVGIAAFAYAKVSQYQREQAEARARAEFLERQEQARKDVAEFRRLTEEAHYYLVGYRPRGQMAPREQQRGERAGKAALDLAGGWGAALEVLPLPDEQPEVKKELQDLLLLLAQARVLRATAAAAQETLTLLDKAAALGDSGTSLARLRAEAYRLAGDVARADEARVAADAAGNRLTPSDQFLLGEQYRLRFESTVDQQGSLKLREQAREYYRAAVQGNPKHYWAHFRLASLVSQDEAPAALGACVALRPESPWAYSTRALALAGLKRFKEAEADIARALELAPGSGHYLLNRGVVADLQGKAKAALDDFTAVLAKSGDDKLWSAAYNRGNIYWRLGDYDKALADFNQILANQPDAYDAYRARALVHFTQRRDADALNDLDKYLGGDKPLDRDSAAAHEQRGRALRQLVSDLPDKPPEVRQSVLTVAAAELDEARLLGGKSPELWADLGLVLQELRRYPEAFRTYTEGVQQTPGNVKLRVTRGVFLGMANQLDQAREDFREAVKADPTHTEAHSWLAYLEARRSDFDAANQHAGLALLYGSGDHLVLHNVACAYAVLSDKQPRQERAYQDQALSLLRRAVEFWEKGNRKGPNALELIRGETAFGKALRARPEFRELAERK